MRKLIYVPFDLMKRPNMETRCESNEKRTLAITFGQSCGLCRLQMSGEETKSAPIELGSIYQYEKCLVKAEKKF